MIAMTGKTVLVTGASRGIGAATVPVLLGLGADVVVHYGRSREAAQALVDAAGPGRALAVGGDLADAAATEAVWDAAEAWKGRIDVLVNNAGIYEPADPDGDLDAFVASWERTLRVNLTAAGQLCRRAVGHFRGHGGGAIVNVASRASFRGDSYPCMQYGASKAGMIALTRSLARHCAADGILAYAVAPGFTATEMADAVSDEEMAGVVAEIPMGAIAPAADVANTIAFLASGAAPHATGTTIDINGASYVR